MTVAYLRRPLASKGTHVLIVGVGAYPHLLGGVGRLTGNPLGLRQLSSPPISARALADWFIARQIEPALSVGFHNPEAPLSSVEMLLSPEGEYAVPGGVPVNIASASIRNIRAALETWLTRLTTDEGSIGVFYFCGHGLLTSEQFLLAEDFGASDLQPWTGAFDIKNTIRAIEQRATGPVFFFLDACQAISRDVLRLGGALAAPLVQYDLAGPTTVPSSLVIHAAREGEHAFGETNQVSRFTKALLRSLSGYAGRKMPGHDLWAVTIEELCRSLFLQIEEDKIGALRQRPSYYRHGDNSVLHYETIPTHELIELNNEIWTERRERLAEETGAPSAVQARPPVPASKSRGHDGAKVFISCADTDVRIGRSLYLDLARKGHKPWLATESLLPGQNIRTAIDDAIRACELFVALNSTGSAKQKGYFRVELKKAIEVLETLPSDAVFIVPARVDECELDHQVLRSLYPVDLFPVYEEGIAKILKVADSVMSNRVMA